MALRLNTSASATIERRRSPIVVGVSRVPDRVRWSVAVLLIVVAMLGSVSDAWAMSATRSDPAGDEVDILTGSEVTDSRVDILSVSIDNELDVVELSVEVDEIVPFTDEAWRDGALIVGGGLHSTRSDAAWAWAGTAASGTPVGALALSDEEDGSASVGCVTGFRATATAYVLTARGACAHGLSRSIEWAGVALAFDGTDSAFDIAPDQSVDGDEPTIYFSAVGTSAGPDGPERLAGTDRTLTAIELSADVYGADDAGAVVLASAEDFPDALAGGPLASYMRAPLLLTRRHGLDGRTRAEMQRVLRSGGTVYVLGGTAALSDQVVTDVDAAGFDARRVAGTDRFATAAAIADVIGDSEQGYDTILLADGRTFTDSLLAAAAAPARLGVVLLTDGATMPSATAAKLAGHFGEQFAIGSAAATAAPAAEAITGPNPSELSVNVARRLVPVSGTVAIATQDNFADALAGGPHVASHFGPLLLTDSNSLSPPTGAAISGAANDIRRVVIYGGTAAISAAIEADINSRMSS